MQKPIYNENEIPENALVKVEIFHDDYSDSPRNWDNIFTLWVKEGNRHLSSDSGAECPLDGEASCWEEQKTKEGLFVLPLYAYVHGGMTVSLHPFSCPWDSGIIGFLYCDKQRFMEEYGLKEFDEKHAFEVAEGEVETFDNYIRGEVYGVRVSRRATPEDEWEEDYCTGGFNGWEDVLYELKDAYKLNNGNVEFWKESSEYLPENTISID